ncbi:TetR/AcrR family transcriptional regulator [Acrocarpospora sp. B8E8]|uniref:TetR/AcrR family transcriptional regulator n=1 Tax=Acrocarpospora sp. B8E8 TaxID=3153572 RepID=UPI00325C7C8F
MRPASKASTAKKSLDGGRARDREVIEAAVNLFWEKGYSATSVQDVADALGMLKGSLYYYIDSKGDLLKKIFEDSHAEVRVIAEAAVALELPAIERLQIFIERYADWSLLHLRRASLYAREWRHADPELRKVMLAQRQYYDQVVMTLIEGAKNEGAADRELDTKLATFFILSAVAALPDWYRPSTAKNAQSVARGYAELALRIVTA